MLSQLCVSWLCLGLICLLFELTAPGFFFCLSFAIATVPAAGAAWYGIPVLGQAGLFIVSSFVSFFVLYLCVGAKSQKDTHYKSAIDALPGKKGYVLEAMSHNHIGQVQLDGQVWSAQAVHQQKLSKGTSVIVVRVEGVRLIVMADPEYVKE